MPVLAVAVWLGRQRADHLVTQREASIGAEIVAALERVAETVDTLGRRHVAPLAGKPCAQADRALATAHSFIESTPLIDDITHFVLRRVVEDINRYGPSAPLHVAVNAAPLSLRRRTFLGDLAALQRAMPDGSGLVLEITERHLLADSGATREAFDRLHQAGIRLAVDDFGTRNSNLDLIKSFPFDYLKIDRQFTQDVDANAQALLRSIVNMAHHFHLVVIAEGIETEAQHALIVEAGVDWAQGYLYQRPAAPASILGRRGIWVKERDDVGETAMV